MYVKMWIYFYTRIRGFNTTMWLAGCYLGTIYRGKRSTSSGGPHQSIAIIDCRVESIRPEMKEKLCRTTFCTVMISFSSSTPGFCNLYRWWYEVPHTCLLLILMVASQLESCFKFSIPLWRRWRGRWIQCELFSLSLSAEKCFSYSHSHSHTFPLLLLPLT